MATFDAETRKWLAERVMNIAPRGVIFRSSLPEWEFKEVGWEEAPYGEEY